MNATRNLIGVLASDLCEHRGIAEEIGAKRPSKVFMDANALSLACQTGDIAAIVLSLHNDADCECRRVIEICESLPQPVVIIVRFGLTPSMVRQAVLLADHTFDLRLSLRESETIWEQVSSIDNPSSAQPTLQLFQRLVPIVPQVAVPIVTAAICTGSQRTPVADLAGVCGVAVRTLEKQLSCASMCEADVLLRWILALNVVWQLTRVGTGSNVIASTVGFKSAALLDRSLIRTLGRTMSQVRHDGSFDSIFAQFVDGPMRRVVGRQ